MVGRITAGVDPDSMEVSTGKCAYITTGSKLPKGADAVVRVRKKNFRILTGEGNRCSESIVLSSFASGNGEKPPRPTARRNQPDVRTGIHETYMRTGSLLIGTCPAVPPHSLSLPRALVLPAPPGLAFGMGSTVPYRSLTSNGAAEGFGTRAGVFYPPFVQHACCTHRTSLLLCSSSSTYRNTYSSQRTP